MSPQFPAQLFSPPHHSTHPMSPLTSRCVRTFPHAFPHLWVTIHLLLFLPTFSPSLRTSSTSFMKLYPGTQDHRVLSFLWTSTSQNFSTPQLCCMSAFLALSFTEMPIDQWPQKSMTLSDLSFCWWYPGLVWEKRVTWLWKKLTSSCCPRHGSFHQVILTLGFFMDNASVRNKLSGLLEVKDIKGNLKSDEECYTKPKTSRSFE